MKCNVSEADGSKERDNDSETDMSCAACLFLLLFFITIFLKYIFRERKNLQWIFHKCIFSKNKFVQRCILKEEFGKRHEVQPASLPKDTKVHYFDLGST